jgi:uncharacterized protein (TIGR00730 family)
MADQPLAYEDPAFLHSDEARPVRILAEYLEPLRRLKQQNIQDTVVFFGSARIHSRAEATRAHNRLRKKRDTRSKEHADLMKRSRKAVVWSRFYEDARELAHKLTVWSLSLESRHHRFAVCSGGGPGIMEAANRGAHDVAAKSIGLNIVLPFEQQPNPYIHPGLCFNFHYFAMRKMHFLLRAKALAFFPGGFGTLDEMFEALTLIQTGKIGRMPCILFGREFWRRLLDFEFLADEGLISPHDLDLIEFVETAEEAWARIQAFYGERTAARRK